MCIPFEWTVTYGGGNLVTIKDAFGQNTVAVNCPMVEESYEGWTIKKRSRTYLYGQNTRGADLWVGTKKTGSTTSALLMLFVHRNGFESWFGENYEDVPHSCQIKSLDPLTNELVFRTMFVSVF